MDSVSFSEREEEERRAISSLPDFSEIFIFLQSLGPYMKLPRINLTDLEAFFRKELWLVSDELVYVQWQLLRYAGRSGVRTDWQQMAVKFALKFGLLSELVPYEEVSLPIRMKIFRVCCEEQLDRNAALRMLKRDNPGMLTRPIGLDREGLRYWLLQDSAFDIRLYGEGNYDQPPPAKPSWTMLSWSLDELANRISLLESRSSLSSTSTCADTAVPSLQLASAGSESPPLLQAIPILDTRGVNAEGNHTAQPRPKRKKPTAAPGKKKSRGQNPVDSSDVDSSAVDSSDVDSKDMQSPSPALFMAELTRSPDVGSSDVGSSDVDSSDGGCLKCRKDVDYSEMLLCDTCDQECHTYCQYPPLWIIPEGRWLCPVCKEEELLQELKAVFLRLSQAKVGHEAKVARKERSVARLQKSGLLLQNIILDEEKEGKRSRRARKEVNYAELNDVYLPPLGPGDMVGREGKFRSVTSSRRNEYAPRVRSTARRYSPAVPDLETLNEEEGEGGREQSSEEKELISPPDPLLLGGGNHIVQPCDGASLNSNSLDDDESNVESSASLRGNNSPGLVTTGRGQPHDGAVTSKFLEGGDSSGSSNDDASLRSGTSGLVASGHVRDGTSASSNSLDDENSNDEGSVENCASLGSGTFGSVASGHGASASPSNSCSSRASLRRGNSPCSVSSRCDSERGSEEEGGVGVLYPVSGGVAW